jgi:hypothetical protein
MKYLILAVSTSLTILGAAVVVAVILSRLNKRAWEKAEAVLTKAELAETVEAESRKPSLEQRNQLHSIMSANGLSADSLRHPLVASIADGWYRGELSDSALIKSIKTVLA